jgi:zinc protease
VFNQARELGGYWVQGLSPDAGAQLMLRLRGVTAQQVQAVAATYFGDDQLTVAVLQPQPLDKTRKPRQPLLGARH